MSWIDPDNEASRSRRAVEEELARHLRWMCCSAVLTLSVAVMAAVTASTRTFLYFVIPFFVSSFFTVRQWLEWRHAKRWLEAAAETNPETAREAVEDDFRCSFCGKPQAEVTHLISSPKSSGAPPAHICDQCVAVCNTVLADLQSGKPKI
jgi:hypothetical protein